MIDELNALNQNALAISVVMMPMILGIVELIKKTVDVPTRYLPALTFGTAIVLSWLVAIFKGYDFVTFTVVGVMGGLSASGLYDQTKISEMDSNERFHQ